MYEQDKVRNQDSVGVLSGLKNSKLGHQLLWEFVKENWSELFRRYGSSTMLAGLIKVQGFFKLVSKLINTISRESYLFSYISTQNKLYLLINTILWFVSHGVSKKKKVSKCPKLRVLNYISSNDQKVCK